MKKIENNIELTNEINLMLKEKGISNRIDAITIQNDKCKFALKNCRNELEWFHLSQAPLIVERYVRKFLKLGG